MFWTTGEGVSYPRVLSADETAGISALYPTASFSSTGTMTGTVRLTSNKPVFGAMVVAVNASGQPVASALTNSSGQYTIQGLPAGSYTVYAEPLDGPISEQNVYTLERIDPNGTINTAFTTRFH
jgi:cysteine synthase